MISGFSEEELKIIDEYLKQGLSIRDIEKLHKGYGRTKINNILESYASFSKENENEVKLKKLSQKNHKQINSTEDINSEELTDKQIQDAYYKIMQGEKTLTALSAELNKNRDTLKNAIINYLADRESIIEFRKILKINQSMPRQKQDFFELDKEQRKEEIFERLNYRRKLVGKNEYPISMLNRKYDRLVKYFNKRNSKIKNKEDRIDDDDLLKMMYDYPTMLSMSLSNKIKPTVKLLDYKYLDFSRASRVLKENPAILGTSLERTGLQMRILKDSETLDFAMEKPRIFRTSPELMYALIEIWKSEKITRTPFITNKKIYEIYSKRTEEIQDEFDIKEKYGDDEYFDRR